MQMLEPSGTPNRIFTQISTCSYLILLFSITSKLPPPQKQKMCFCEILKVQNHRSCHSHCRIVKVTFLGISLEPRVVLKSDFFIYLYDLPPKFLTYVSFSSENWKLFPGLLMILMNWQHKVCLFSLVDIYFFQ